jgi:hypothetical protein
MKCGTTSLARWLGAHPEVFMAANKEVHFFDDFYRRGLGWYGKQFSAANGRKAIGEATPNYIYDQSAFGRMADTLPDARVIVMLRNPVDRAYSHYWHNRARGREPGLSFEQAIDAEPKRITSGDAWAKRTYSYLDRGIYQRQLESILSRYPQARLHVAFLEDMKDQPVEVFKAACKFLEVSETVVPEQVGHSLNPYVHFRSPKVRVISRKMPHPFRRIIGRLNARTMKYPPMAPGTRARLVEHFRPHNESLARFLGRDLSIWDR